MRPEVVGAFRLAMAHEETAGVIPWIGRKGHRRRWKTAQQAKHLAKAQKLYHRAAELEARGIK